MAFRPVTIARYMPITEKGTQKVTFQFAIVISDEYGQSIHLVKKKKDADELYKAIKEALTK